MARAERSSARWQVSCGKGIGLQGGVSTMSAVTWNVSLYEKGKLMPEMRSH